MEKKNTQRENWICLINQILEQADALTLRRAYYLLVGFLGDKVSGSDTERDT